ncbi:hypothetical protein TI04_07140 [Achromatium sp. WMS2]|nr:hypothetical protein TI04_07140 [Achromatium sp. WMS2]
MKVSARNQFFGPISAIKTGPINAEVVIDIGNANRLVAIVTRDSAEYLRLSVGISVYAFVKAPWIIITTEPKLKTSARNKLCGVIISCQEGALNTEVVLELAGGKNIIAIITNESARTMELAVGQSACALIKSSHVILAVVAD